MVGTLGTPVSSAPATCFPLGPSSQMKRSGPAPWGRRGWAVGQGWSQKQKRQLSGNSRFNSMHDKTCIYLDINTEIFL